MVLDDERPKGGGLDAEKGPVLALPHACCFVTWLLHCTHRRRPCFLLVAMPLHCLALPPYPWRSYGPATVAVANAKALQLPLPPKLGWPVPQSPPSCCGPPQAPLGPTGWSKAGTTCRCKMPGNSGRRHDKWLWL